MLVANSIQILSLLNVIGDVWGAYGLVDSANKYCQCIMGNYTGGMRHVPIGYTGIKCRSHRVFVLEYT
jgi:hypothetical protein